MKKLSKAEKMRRFKKTKKYANKQEKKRLNAELKRKDKEWKSSVFERDNYECQICKSLGINKKISGKNCHPHHIIPKIFRPLSLDINNGITTCYQHHKVNLLSPHMNALWFSMWLKENKFSQWDYLMQAMNYEHIANGKEMKKFKEDEQLKEINIEADYAY